jgi:hypothetical protein
MITFSLGLRRQTAIVDIFATLVALRMDGAALLPDLKDMRTNLRLIQYA